MFAASLYGEAFAELRRLPVVLKTPRRRTDRRDDLLSESCRNLDDWDSFAPTDFCEPLYCASS